MVLYRLHVSETSKPTENDALLLFDDPGTPAVKTLHKMFFIWFVSAIDQNSTKPHIRLLVVMLLEFYDSQT